MLKKFKVDFRNNIYLFYLAIIIIIGYFPVSFQILSLKNDILQLDLPVKFFISQELHRGELPIWIYSWKAGFPLGHLFTWSSYNPFTLFFCGIFKYDIHILHLEFITYLLIGSFGVYILCKKILLLSPVVCLTAGVIYSLSGITVSCSQFLAYISSIAILPWIFFFVIDLMRKPGLLNCLYFAITCFLLISWSYPGIVIVSFYAIFLFFVASHFLFDSLRLSKKSISYIFLAAFIVGILCLPMIYITLKTLPLFSRSNELMNNDNNFGFLHIHSLLTVFYPFLTADENFTDTTFLFQNIYIGIISVGVLIIGFVYSSQTRKNRIVRVLFISSLVALILSCGESLYLKNFLDNVLPGFKWFRFPSLFRVFYLLPVTILIGIILEEIMLQANKKGFIEKSRKIFLFIFLFSSGLILYKIFSTDNFFLSANYKSGDRSALYSSIHILCLAWLLLSSFYFFKIKSFKLLPMVVIMDLLLMTLISMPIYSISSYTLKDVKRIIEPTGNINNQISIDQSNSTFVDTNGNVFNGINVYSNNISIKNQYTGPLFLKSFDQLSKSKYQWHLPDQLIFTDDAGISSKIIMSNGDFKNHIFSADVFLEKSDTLKLFQLWHPFWKAFVNGKENKISQSREGIVQTILPAGEHNIEFIYGDKTLTFLNYLFFSFLSLLILSIGIITFRKKYVQKV